MPARPAATAKAATPAKAAKSAITEPATAADAKPAATATTADARITAAQEKAISGIESDNKPVAVQANPERETTASPFKSSDISEFDPVAKEKKTGVKPTTAVAGTGETAPDNLPGNIATAPLPGQKDPPSSSHYPSLSEVDHTAPPAADTPAADTPASEQTAEAAAAEAAAKTAAEAAAKTAADAKPAKPAEPAAPTITPNVTGAAEPPVVPAAKPAATSVAETQKDPPYSTTPNILPYTNDPPPPAYTPYKEGEGTDGTSAEKKDNIKADDDSSPPTNIHTHKSETGPTNSDEIIVRISIPRPRKILATSVSGDGGNSTNVALEQLSSDISRKGGASKKKSRRRIKKKSSSKHTRKH